MPDSFLRRVFLVVLSVPLCGAGLLPARAQTQSAAQPPAQQSQGQPQQAQQAQQAQSESAQLNLVVDTTGIVRTGSGAQVPGATIRLSNPQLHKTWVSWTDENGQFVFPQLPAGIYHIEVSQIGFEPASLDVRLPVMPKGPIPVALKVATLAELTQQPAPEGAPGADAPAKSAAPGAATGPGASDSTAKAGAPGGPGRGAGAGGRGNYNGPGTGRPGPGRTGPGSRNAGGMGPGGMGPGGMNGGFQETGFSGASGPGGQSGDQAIGESGQDMGAALGNAASASDSFLLQGTVGQGLSTGPGGPGGGGPIMLLGGPGGPGQQPSQGGAVPFGGGPGGPGEFGGGPVVFIGGPGPGGGRGGRGGGLFAGGGRFGRQQVNHIRFGFNDDYSNSIFDAQPYALNGRPASRPSFYHETFGANAGGLIPLPGVDNVAHPTFFFANYQRRMGPTAVDNVAIVPSDTPVSGFGGTAGGERAGNFCGVNYTGTKNPIELYNPATGALIQNCPVTAANPQGIGTDLGASGLTLDPAALALLQFIPHPNMTPVGGQPFNFRLVGTSPSSTDSVNAHIFHTLNAKFNMNGGYNLSASRSDGLGSFPGFDTHTSSLSQAVSLGLGHNWTPNFVENLSLAWSRNREQSGPQDSLPSLSASGCAAGNYECALGIQGVSGYARNYGLPELGFANVSGLTDAIPSLTRNQTLEFGDGFTWVHGKHNLHFGADMKRIELNFAADPNPRGQFTFTGNLTAQPGQRGTGQQTSGYDFADFLLGLPYSAAVQYGITQTGAPDPNIYLRSWGADGYLQDDWRVHPAFTLDLGLRYDWAPAATELFNRLADLEFNPGVTSVVVITPGETGTISGFRYPASMVSGNSGNFEPRVGFAWQPPVKLFKRTVTVRGGYSIFYDESIFDTLVRELTYQAPWAADESLVSTGPGFTLENALVSSNGGGIILNTEGVAPNYKNAYAQMWTLSTETELSRAWMLNFTYTGTKGTHLDLLRIPNRAPLGTPTAQVQQMRSDPNATGFLYDQSGAGSLYNGVQARLVHRFSSAFMGMFMYTFAKSLDNSSSLGGGGTEVVQQDGNYAAEWGLSSFDVRQQIRGFSVYQLPMGQHRHWFNYGWKDQVFGNWRLMNMVTWQTGRPYTAILGGTAADNGTGANLTLRAEQIGNPNLGFCGSTGQFFNPAAFTTPPAGAYGDERRGAIEGPCAFDWNVSLNRSFRFGASDRRRFIDARWDVDNVTNTPRFTGLGTTLLGRSFGQITGAGANMRSMDISLRVMF